MAKKGRKRVATFGALTDQRCSMNTTLTKKIIVAGCLLWNVSACAATEIIRSAAVETIHWKEEVALHDGKTLVVNRSVTLGGTRKEPGTRNVGESNYTLSFTAPDGREIAWENPGQLRLMILDFEGGMPYLATEPAMVSHYFDYGCPEPSYVFFRYENDWKRIKYEEFPLAFKNSNFLISSRGDGLREHGFVSAEQVKEMNRNLDKNLRAIDPKSHSPHPPCPLIERFNKVPPKQFENIKQN